MTSERFSFIIPAYNDEIGLQRHLDYFFARDEVIQLVIVDDCSSDDTPKVVAKANPPDHIEIAYHRQKVNSGPAMARNIGLKSATGDFVMFLDADDQLADTFFDYIRLSPLMNGVDFVLFKYHLAHDIDHRYTYEMHQTDAAFFSQIDHSGFPMKTFRLAELPGALRTVNFPWNKIYRGDFIRNCGISFPNLRMHEDIPPHWHSFLRAKSFGVLSWAPPLITHFEAGTGRATDYIGEQRLELFPLLKTLNSELEAHENADLIIAEFQPFCENLFSWMTDVLCASNTGESLKWRVQYQDEIDKFWDSPESRIGTAS